MRLDAANRVSYVEPVATDPNNRRMGLGTIVVLEAYADVRQRVRRSPTLVQNRRSIVR
jgi:ribosomal protein S18 acetylase RimI-like enzyme